MASEIELATLGASVLGLLRRNGARASEDGRLTLVEQGILPGGVPVPIAMRFVGLVIFTATGQYGINQWIKFSDSRPRVKLMIQNRGTGATPNAGNAFFADRQLTGVTEGIRILPDGHLWDENGAHSGEIWVLGDTVGMVVAVLEWGVAAVTTV